MANRAEKKLPAYLSALEAWGLAFGCSIGWGCFMMPGTSFLPVSGTVGIIAGIAIEALLMMVIGANYFSLMKRFSGAGGSFTYTTQAFGSDHGFLCSWFLFLTYIGVVWANMTVFPLVARYLFGDVFRFGFLCSVAGYEIYLGEVLLSACALAAACALCVLRKKSAAATEAVLALVAIGGIAICFAAAAAKGSPARLQPLFAKGEPTHGTGAERGGHRALGLCRL